MQTYNSLEFDPFDPYDLELQENAILMGVNLTPSENPEVRCCEWCDKPLYGCQVVPILGAIMHKDCADEFQVEYNSVLDNRFPQ